jgi:putative aldouronate transport system permease protein
MKRRKVSIADLILLMFLGIFALVCFFPFYQTVILSFSTMAAVGTQRVFLYPVSVDFGAYSYLINEGKMLRGMGITAIVTVLGTFIALAVTTAGAYGLTKKAMPGRNFIFNAILVTMFFGGGLVPYFLTIQALHLPNTIWVMILPSTVSAFNLILMRNYLNALPGELEESAKIDGANEIIILWKIIIPVSAPIMATIALFCAVGYWNEWWNAMLFINNTKMYPLMLVLREAIMSVAALLNDPTAAQFAESSRVFYSDSVKAAIIVISAVPILLVYPFLQKYFARGIMIGSIKG